MPSITIAVPSINAQAYYTFKDPINTYLKNTYNLDSLTVKLRVISVISMRDMIRNDFRDPFTTLYAPSAISEVEYKKDLKDNVPIVSFSFIDNSGVEKFVRVPLNYIATVSSVTSKEYINKLILIDMNKLPVELDLTTYFTDLSDFITGRTGITPVLKEVSIGNIELVTQDEHSVRETVRSNMVTVFKTLSTQLEELSIKYNGILARLQVLGIILG